MEEAMKTKSVQTALIIACVLIGIRSAAVMAQVGMRNEIATFTQRNLSGPRLGVTFIAGGHELKNQLKGKNIGNVLSQFGWHFEYQVVPETVGPSFVVELVPLVAAVEYGTLIPSASLVMGIRFPSGIEFGLGPNILVDGDEKKPVHTALVVAVGKSFNFGGVSIPLNQVCVTSPEGNRFSFVFGYAITKSVSKP
jgi:hypothetical protein